MSDDTQSNEVNDTPDVVTSLDEVIDSYNDNVDHSQNFNQNQNTPQEQAAPQPQVPQTTLDPFDEAQMSRFAQNNANQFGHVDSKMNDLDSRLLNFEKSQEQQKVTEDIKGAVDIVNNIVGHDNEKWIEFQIAEKVRTNSGFANLWNTRNSNSGASRSFNKALVAIGNEMKSSTEMKSDPQLIENQRAANLSQQNIESGSSNVTSYEESLSNSANEAERQAVWQAMIDS